MIDAWTIIGEEGATIDATELQLPDLRAEGLEIMFRRMAVSTATWTVWLRNVAEIPIYVPDLRQRISIYLNGDRFFTGWVTGRQPLHDAGRLGYAITVSDAWYFLENTPISSPVEDGAGDESERPVYLLAKGDLKADISSVAARAITVGMPVELGGMADCFDVPRLSLRQGSYADGLSDLMAFLADGSLFLDHGGVGESKIRLSRRDTAGTIDVVVGTAVITEMNLKPRVDLEVEEMKITYATRKTSGSKRVTGFETLSAGTATSTLPTRGLVAVSGPEVNLTLPQDLTDSVVVKSAAFGTGEQVGAALAIWHDLLKAGEASLSGVMVYTSQETDEITGASTSWPDDPMLIVTDPEGNDIDLANWPYYLTKGEIKDWFEKDGIEAINARVTAKVASSVILPNDDPVPETPKWARVLGAQDSRHFVMAAGELATRYVWQASVSAVVPLVKTLWAEDTTLIRQEDWGWFHPPEDLADNLLATQNWMPWEGRVGVIQETLEHGNPVGEVLNVTNWVPETATMRAIISACSIRPRTGLVTYDVGPPARHSFLDLVNRFRQSGSDNIYWLSAPGDTGTPTPTAKELTEDGQVTLTEDGQVTIDENG